MRISANWVPEAKLLTFEVRSAPSGKTRTSSDEFGAPTSQLAAVVQLLLPPRPVQVCVAGARRSSSASTRGRAAARRGFAVDFRDFLPRAPRPNEESVIAKAPPSKKKETSDQT